MASDNEVRLQLKGGRTIKIVRTETPTGGMWSIPEMPEIAAHQNISVIRDRLRGKGLIASRPGTPARFAVEDRFYFGKGRKERFADDIYLDPKTAAHIAHYVNKILGSMKPMGERRMDAAILQAISQLTKIRATLLAPKFVSTSTLKTMMGQVDGLSKQFGGLYRQYSDESTNAEDQKRLVEREYRKAGPPRSMKAWVLEGRKYREMTDLQKDIEKLDALFHEAWRLKHALESLANTQMR